MPTIGDLTWNILTGQNDSDESTGPVAAPEDEAREDDVTGVRWNSLNNHRLLLLLRITDRNHYWCRNKSYGSGCCIRRIVRRWICTIFRYAVHHIFFLNFVAIVLWHVHAVEKTVLPRLDPVSNLQLLACSHGRDKTGLSCRVGGVNTTADKTRGFCLVHVGGVNKDATLFMFNPFNASCSKLLLFG